MEKTCYPVWRHPDTPADEVAGWLLERASERLSAPSVRGATLHVESAEHGVLRYGAGPAGLLLTGLVSVWFDSYQDAGALTDLLATGPFAAWHGYLVSESVPSPYGAALTWAEGERSPGLSIVTLLDRPAEVAEAEFYHRWHELHRLTTAQCHPFASYVRNEVVRAVEPPAPALRGIVTEAAASTEDLLDPDRFYVSGGDPERLRANQKRVFGEVVSFIDMATLQVAPMYEYVLRRLAPTSP